MPHGQRKAGPLGGVLAASVHTDGATPVVIPGGCEGQAKWDQVERGPDKILQAMDYLMIKGEHHEKAEAAGAAGKRDRRRECQQPLPSKGGGG